MTPPPFPAAAIAAARDAVRGYLSIVGDAEVPLIEALAETALVIGEGFTGISWIARDWQEVLGAARGWQRLAKAPVTAITAVEGLPAEGAAFALPTDAYAIDIDARGEGWVRVIAPGAAGRIRVTYGAGAAAGWGDLPPPLRQGAVLLTAHMFENRAGEGPPPAAVSALWRPWRRMRLAAAARR